MSSRLQSEHHLDPDRFSAFVDGALPEQERLEAVVHLAECSDCRQVITLLHSDDEQVGELAPVTPGWRLWFVFHPLLGTASVALASVFVAVIVFTSLERSRSFRPVQVAQSDAPPSVTLSGSGHARPNGPPSPSVDPHLNSAQAARAGALPLKKTVSPPIKIDSGQSYDAQVAAAASALRLDADETDGLSIEGGDAPKVAMSNGRHPSPLPGGLPAIAVVSRIPRKLAADSAGNLFLSPNEGGRWSQVKQQWEGKILRLAVSSGLPIPPERVGSTDTPENTGVAGTPKSSWQFELTTESGAWISRDGLHWQTRGLPR